MITHIDWAGIRAASVTLGIRAAARRAGADLPKEEQERFVQRVMRRASREGWMKQVREVTADALGQANANANASDELTPVRRAVAPRPQAAQMSASHAKPLSAPVRTGAQIVANELAEMGRATRMNLSRAVYSGAEHASQLSGEEVLEAAKGIKELAGTAAVLHGWSEAAAPVVHVSIMSGERPVDARVIEG